MKYKKLLFVCLMTILFLLTALAVFAEGTEQDADKPTEGQCGSYAVWRFDAQAGTLAVSGTDDLPDCVSGTDVPWHPVAADIRSVVIRQGITAIGTYSFAGCRNLTRVQIPASVTAVADNAFHGCVSLSDIVYGGTQTAWKQAFSGRLSGDTAIHFGQEEPQEREMTGIAVTALPEKTVYLWGESFDPTGMRVSALYDDGTAKDITEASAVSPSLFLTAREQTVTVRYEDFTAAFSVTVKKVKYIRVTKKPDKAVYMVGASLETDGMVVTVTYEDDSTREITEGFKCLRTELHTVGNPWITVTYGGTATAFWVKVKSKEASVTQIRVSQKPDKCVYMEGMPLVTDGMRLKVTYEDGSTEKITEGFRCRPAALENVGLQWITVVYGGIGTAFPVKVKPRAESVAKIRVTRKPDKTVYLPGEPLETAGMIVTVTYEDGSTEEITEGFRCDTLFFTSSGLQWIPVIYGGTATAFPVKVKSKWETVKTIRVAQKPDKTVYVAGSPLITDGMILRVTFEDGTTEDITEGFKCAPLTVDTANAAGYQWITVTCGGTATAFPVKVIPVSGTCGENVTWGFDVETGALAIGGSGDMENYAGSGLQGRAPWNIWNGSVRSVTVGSGVTAVGAFAFAGNDELTEVMLPDELVSVGEGAFSGCSSLETVMLPLSAASVGGRAFAGCSLLTTVTLPRTVSPTDIDVFDGCGALRDIYYGGSEEEWQTLWGENMPFGEDTVIHCDFPVRPFTALTVEKAPDKKLYTPGKPIQTDGMTLKVTYADGTSGTVTDGFTCTPDTAGGVGQQTVTVQYCGRSAAFDVNVIESPVTIASVMQPVFASEQTVKIKFIGDSITQGVGSSDYNPTGEVIITRNPTAWSRNLGEKSWAALLEKRLETEYHAEVTNNAIRGVSTHQILYFWNELVDGDEDVVLCMLGTNNRTLENETNFTYTTDSLYSELQTIKNRLEAKGTKVIFMSPPPASEANEEKSGKHFHMSDVAEVYRRMASDNETEYIDLYQKTLDYAESTGTDLNSLFADGLHPNDRLYALMYEWICEALGLE